MDISDGFCQAFVSVSSSHRQTVFSVDDDVALFVTFVKGLSINLTQFMTRTCTYVDREVRVTVEIDVIYTFSQFLYVRYVFGQIDILVD